MIREKKVDTAKVVVIWTTPLYVDYVWTASKGVAAERREKFKQAFLALDRSKPEHAAVMELQGPPGSCRPSHPSSTPSRRWRAAWGCSS
jgi:phosphonate transport system substrate-binding protein